MFAVSPLPRNLSAALRDATHPKTPVRRAAVADLARHVDGPGRAEVVALLARLLDEDPEPTVRAMAALAAADGGATELIPPLVEALSDSSLEVRRHALIALGELGELQTPGLVAAVQGHATSEHPALRYQALVALHGLSQAQARPCLLGALEDGDEEVRWVALQLLWETEGEPVPFDAKQRGQLIQCLREPSPRVRLRAAFVLARERAPEAEAVLVAAVESGRGLGREERQQAIEVVGDFGVEAARSALRRLARRGWFEGLHGWAALVALAQLGDAQSREAIRDELGHRDAERRMRAVLAVERLGTAQGLEWLRGLPERAAGAERELVETTIERMRRAGTEARPVVGPDSGD